MSTETENRDAEDSADETREVRDEFTIPRVNLTDDRRITIPADDRDEFDIAEGDVVDIYIERDGEIDITALDLDVDSSGRIRVPSKKVKLYGLSPDERLNVTVRTTNLAME